MRSENLGQSLSIFILSRYILYMCVTYIQNPFYHALNVYSVGLGNFKFIGRWEIFFFFFGGEIPCMGGI